MNQTYSYFLLQNYIDISEDIRLIIKKYLHTLFFQRDMISQYNLSIQSLIDDYNVFNRNLMNINDIICPIIEIRGISYDYPQDDITRIMYKTTNNKIRSLLKNKITRDKKRLHIGISKFMTPIETIHK